MSEGYWRNVSGEESATISWKQPDCMSQYEVVVVSEAECPQGRPGLECLEEASRTVMRGERGEGRAVSVRADNLTDCTQYRALVRSKGREELAISGLQISWFRGKLVWSNHRSCLLESVQAGVSSQSDQLYSEVWPQFPPAEVETARPGLHWELHSQDLQSQPHPALHHRYRLR